MISAFKSMNRFLLSAACIGALWVSTATAEEFPVIDLSLSSAILFALHDNPDTDIFMERYAQSLSSIKDAESALYPQISVNAFTGREYNNPSSTNGASDVNNYAIFGGQIEQLIFDGFETQQEIKRYENLSQTAYWTAQNKVEEVLTNTVEAYLAILEFQQKTQINTALLADVQDTVAYINDQYEAGAADKVIVDYANSRLSNARTELNKTQSSLNDAVSNLEFLTGKLPPRFTTHYPELLNPDKLDLQYYLNLSEHENSQLIASEYEIMAKEHQLAGYRGRDLPSINFVIDASQAHNSGGESGIERSATAFLRLDYDLYDGGKRKHVKQRIKSEINELSIQHTRILKEVQREIKQAYNQVRSSQDSLDATEAEIRSSTALKALNEENFRLGNVNVIELIESAERLYAAKLKQVELTNDMYLNSYRMLILSSMLGQDFFCASCGYE